MGRGGLCVPASGPPPISISAISRHERYVRTAWTLAERRQKLIGDLYLDAYGSGPLSVPAPMQRGLRYKPKDADPACFAALVELSHRMTHRNVRLVVVFPPVHPAFRRSYPGFDTWTEHTVRVLGAETERRPHADPAPL